MTEIRKIRADSNGYIPSTLIRYGKARVYEIVDSMKVSEDIVNGEVGISFLRVDDDGIYWVR